jgi:hypothetical protein
MTEATQTARAIRSLIGAEKVRMILFGNRRAFRRGYEAGLEYAMAVIEEQYPESKINTSKGED